MFTKKAITTKMSIVLVLTQILMVWISIANCQTKAPQISGIINFNDWDEIEFNNTFNKKMIWEKKQLLQ
jgi:hypothetical protein